MKSILTFLTCLIGLCPAPQDVPSDGSPSAQISGIETTSGTPIQRALDIPFNEDSLAGNYLASRFAQRHHDWPKAEEFLSHVLDATPDDPQLLSRSMILAMGSSQPEKAIGFAKKVLEHEPDNSLASLFLATQSFKTQNYDEAAQYISNLPDGSLSEFMMPLMYSWAKAGTGEHVTKDLDSNTIHIYHAVLIADYLDERSHIETLLERSLGAQGLTLEDVERIADVYAHIGKSEIALELYGTALAEWPENTRLQEKIKALNSEGNAPLFQSIERPEQGVAEALYDMAMLLFREHSDESARVFANMGLYLSPDMTQAKLLLAHISSRNEQPGEAIKFYQAVKPDDENFKEARRLAAGLLEDEDRDVEAMAELQLLFREYKDVDALIQIGDIYRRNEDYGKAIATYNQVEETFGNKIPNKYWHLHYVRGMSYEQNGQWDKAEADLKAALNFQPNHPLVLNYLGYAWADQGVNLKRSLEFIRQAAAQEETDGYIIDSLGWVLYRMGSYEEAVPHLERAVELLPYDPIINDHLGDAYWQVGRRLEARFQWARAKNHTEDEELVSTIDGKLEDGLQTVNVVKEAHSQTSDTGETLKH